MRAKEARMASWLVRCSHPAGCGLLVAGIVAAAPASAASVVEIFQLGEHGWTRLVNVLDCPETACVGKARIELDSQGNRPVTVDVAVAFHRDAALLTMKSDAVA